MSTGAESVHSVGLLRPREPFGSESSIAPGGAPVGALGRHVLKTFNALAWAAIAVLFFHDAIQMASSGWPLGSESVWASDFR